MCNRIYARLSARQFSVNHTIASRKFFHFLISAAMTRSFSLFVDFYGNGASHKVSASREACNCDASLK